MSLKCDARLPIILKRAAVCLLTMVLIAKGLWALEDQSAEATAQFEAGAQYLLDGETMKAIAILKTLPPSQTFFTALESDLRHRVKAQPSHWEPSIMLGLAYIYHEQWPQAAAIAKATLTSYPNIGWNHLILAYAAAKENHLEPAIQAAQMTVHFLPRLPVANVLLGLGYWLHHDHLLALKQVGLTLFSFHLSELWWVLNQAMDGLVVQLPNWAAILLLLFYFLLLRRLWGVRLSLWQSLKAIW